MSIRVICGINEGRYRLRENLSPRSESQYVKRLIFQRNMLPM